MSGQKISNFKKNLVGITAAVTGSIASGCGPNYIPSTYTPPPTAYEFPQLNNELVTYLSKSTNCEFNFGPSLIEPTCWKRECVSSTTRPTPYCEDVYHSATKGGKYSEPSPAYTTRECGVRDATICLKEDWVTKWKLFPALPGTAYKTCNGVTADYEVNDQNGSISSVVIKVQYENSTERIPYYGSDVRSFTDFINKYYCKR
ncbi:MAG: hypothetical protein AABY26_04800 [Nanoarchaeota archaeon]